MFAQVAANAIWTTSQYEDAAVQEPELHLVSQQSASLKGLASEAFMDGLETLDLSSGGIPDYREFNPRFLAATGWQAIAVLGVTPTDVFFRHLAERRFPVSNFPRQHSSLDYNDEPDMFHASRDCGRGCQPGAGDPQGVGVVTSLNDRIAELDANDPLREFRHEF